MFRRNKNDEDNMRDKKNKIIQKNACNQRNSVVK